jgi:CheY-like chemotaxis protein
MKKVRILHVDDEPDIREVVDVSLRMDPNLEARSCSSGSEALVVAAEWQPDLILLDVMMPVMDGPAMVVHLRSNRATATIPVVFMTARTTIREANHFQSLGAIGTISKPFDPMILAASLRRYVRPEIDPLDDLRAAFLHRLKKDSAALRENRAALYGGVGAPETLGPISPFEQGISGVACISGFAEISDAAATLGRIKHIAHRLSGAAGIYGFAKVSDAAADLEEAVIAELAARGLGEGVAVALGSLIAHVERCCNS